MQICCSVHSVTFNTMATQHTCSLNVFCRPHWLVQWSRHCSHTCIPVHSPWLPGYSDVPQTILVILTMAGLFLDRPCVQHGAKVGLQLWVYKTEFILVLLFIIILFSIYTVIPLCISIYPYIYIYLYIYLSAFSRKIILTIQPLGDLISHPVCG